MSASRISPSILVYHNLVPDQRTARGMMKDSVRLSDFERQLSLLKEKRFHFLTVGEAVIRMNGPGGVPPRSVVVTFDDGYRTTYTLGRPVLQRLGVSATVFLVTDFVGSKHRFPWLPAHDGEDLTPLNWEQAGRFDAEGIEIGSHTARHAFLPLLEDKEIEDDLLKSKSAIAEKIGRRGIPFSLPFSFPLTHRQWPSFSSNLVSAVSTAGYSCCCTLLRGGMRRIGPVTFLPRIAVTGRDGLLSFYMKALGLYVYTAPLHSMFQRLFKRYR